MPENFSDVSMADERRRSTDQGTGDNAARVALIERSILVMLVLGLFIGVLAVVRPFTIAIQFGAALATAAWPIRQALVRQGLGRGPTAALLLLLSLVLVVLPMLAFAPHLADQMVQGTQRVQSYFAATPEEPAWIKAVPLLGRRLGAGCRRCGRGDTQRCLRRYRYRSYPGGPAYLRPGRRWGSGSGDTRVCCLAACDQPDRRPAARVNLGWSGVVAVRARPAGLGRVHNCLGRVRQHGRQFHQALAYRLRRRNADLADHPGRLRRLSRLRLLGSVHRADPDRHHVYVAAIVANRRLGSACGRGHKAGGIACGHLDADDRSLRTSLIPSTD